MLLIKRCPIIIANCMCEKINFVNVSFPIYSMWVGSEKRKCKGRCLTGVENVFHTQTIIQGEF